MRVTRALLIGVPLLVVSVAVSVAQQAPAPAPAAPLVSASHLRMQPGDVPTNESRVIIYGDPAKPGMYIYRNRFAKGTGTRPHYHDQDRWVTVISGTWWTDEGDVYRPDKMVAIKAGGVMFHPKGLRHYDGAKDEDAVVQIMGMGPVQTVQAEVDANGKPVPPPPGTR